MKRSNLMIKNRFLLFFICQLPTAYCQLVFSQQSSTGTAEISSSIGIDTNYVKCYPNKLIVGVWQSVRSFDITLAQKMTRDSGRSTINYIANSNNVTGISLDYDILSASFGYKSVASGDKRTGNTDYLDFGLTLNTKGLRFENSYVRRCRGPHRD